MNEHDAAAAETAFLEKIMRYQDGALSADEVVALEAEMRADAAKRRAFAGAQMRSMALHDRFRQDAFRVQPPAKRSAWLASLVSRPFAAAAAGLAFGLVCASFAWAVASPSAVATMVRVFALEDGSFEKSFGKLPSGFPRQTGLWGGDDAEIVSTGPSAKDGSHALRFVRAEGDENMPGSPANSCDVWQLVDLRGLKATARAEATLELSASFLDARAERGEDIRFHVRVYAFAGAPERLHSEWPMAIKEALAFGSNTVGSSGGHPDLWLKATARTVLPSGVDFAVVQLVASKQAPHGTAAQFGEQFADEVRLTLRTQPQLPVRVARR